MPTEYWGRSKNWAVGPGRVSARRHRRSPAGGDLSLLYFHTLAFLNNDAKMRAVFAGVDVACAKNKRLPVAVCQWRERRLVPVPLADLPFVPPAGRGNAAACDLQAVEEFAAEAAEYLRRIQDRLGVQIVRIGIDAPSAPRGNRTPRRAAEAALDNAGIQCFTTPSEEDFLCIRKKVEEHLRTDGGQSNLPHASQLWMQVGFALFRKLGDVAECIEVYPQATVCQLGAGAQHKAKPNAVERQLAAAAHHTGWPSDRIEDPGLEEIGFGPRHDRLDAYLAAWVAALDEADRIAFGTPPDDVIWVPRLSKTAGDSRTEEPRSAKHAAWSEARLGRRRTCPACPKEFAAFPLGWDAHAAYRCSGLRASDPKERKREYKRRFGHLFSRGGP